ncbi:hypothetical protein EVAR_50252_1 [Eumeta japonica]|uniref:Mariner Mos1 transposase n=1 Tax=Eumeta variegata TaxID=151549 RepID=A0A4C1YMH3_EUMVA|nr:hypothetical protein EVAR_50252_1 [Eumeta japonica]
MRVRSGVACSRFRIILHHDNVGYHMSAETTRFLEGQKIELTGHVLYSSDLAPSDLYLFPNVKNKSRGQRFLNREEAIDALHVLEIPQSEWKKSYKNWISGICGIGLTEEWKMGEGNGMVESVVGYWNSRSLDETYSGSCYFTSVFCESEGSRPSGLPIYVLRPS